MLRLSAIPFRTSVLAAVISVAACSGGGGGGSSDSATSSTPVKSFSTATLEGAYNGTLRDATSQAQMQLVILENGEFWAVYGQDDSSTFWVDGFTHGKAVSQAGSVRIDDLRDFGHLPPTSAPMNGRYDDSANTLSGTITGPDGDIAIEAGRVTDGALYEYHAPADPVQLAGLWGMQSMRHGAGTLSIHADGGLHASSNQGCTAYGSAKPRSSGRNVFDVQMTYGPLCEEPDKQVSGVAVVYPMPGSALQLFIAVTDSEREFGDLLLAGAASPGPTDAPAPGAQPSASPALPPSPTPVDLAPLPPSPAPPSLSMSFRLQP